MAAITPDEARAYLRRFELALEMQTAELRRTSMETKLLQLSALVASRDVFGAPADREPGVLAVRERWARLRRASGG